MHRGISITITEVILIAVAIALAIALAVWVFSLVKANIHATILRVLGEWLFTSSNGAYLVLYVENPGSGLQKIVGVQVNNEACIFQGASLTIPSTPSALVGSSLTGVNIGNGTVTITSGVVAYLVYWCNGTYILGNRYDGAVYLASGVNILFVTTAH